MNQGIRRNLRRLAPARAKRAVHSIRKVIAQPPIDDAVLADYRFAADTSDRPRLTFVMPNLAPGEAFGGVSTGIDIVLSLAKEMQASLEVDLRLILTDPDQTTNAEIFTRSAQTAGLDSDRIECVELATAEEAISVRAGDLFITYNWWTTLNIEPLLDQQAAHFGQSRRPLIYLIQEYEPNIFPFSSGHLLAREAYDTPKRLWAMFNSSALKAYFELQGHSVERGWTLEPVVNDKLRPFLEKVASSQRKRRILVYGRPTVNRNCFPALVRGLKHWTRDYPQFREWELVSAGTPHDPVDLGDGRELRSLGKLPLEEYATILLESSVGISLMASPHPSYPPLEMAHFGLRTLTNRYTLKDLADYHPNILSLPSISSEALAKGLAQACEEADSAPSDYCNPEFVRADKFPFLKEMARALIDAAMEQP